MQPSRDIADLLAIMAALRDPDGGCPWDRVQTFETIAPYTLEEASEVADAIARGDLEDLRDELGDLLFQVVFHAQMASERGAFDFGGVVEAITSKMVRRHPHVFGAERGLSGTDIAGQWDRIKAEERAERAARRAGAPEAGALAGVASGLPALARALKLQAKAADVGFDWDEAAPILAKIHEEAREIADAADRGDARGTADEVGDLLFAVVNLARHLKVDPELALRRTNAKFERRFAAIEQGLANAGKRPEEASLAEMDALWNAAKAAERSD
jgi:ATP diphosphatase